MEIQFSIETARNLLNQSPVGTLLFAADGGLLWANERAAQMLSTSAESVEQMTSEDIKSRFTPAGDGVFRIGESPTVFQIINRDINDAQQTYHAWFISDVSAAQADRKPVSEYAMLDPDTGLLTYPALLQNLELLVTRSRRYGNPLSLLKIDVRSTSETVPQEALLTAVGHMLKDQMRWADLISRGDDGRFLIIMPETPVDSADGLVDKIRQNLVDLTVPFPGDSGEVVANFGLTAWGKGDDAGLIMERLDEALGEALGGDGKDLVRM